MGNMNDLFAAQDALQHLHHHITLASATDLAGFRRAARSLLAQRVPPAEVMWHVALHGSGQVQDLFAGSFEVQNSPTVDVRASVTAPAPNTLVENAVVDAGAHAVIDTSAQVPIDANARPLVDVPARNTQAAPAISVPPEFLALCENVILHSDPNRFGLLYRLLWRMVREPGLRHDPLDADRLKAAHMAQVVRRDMHKMKAFVRFRTVQDDAFRTHPEGGPLHVAWFEPDHHIVEAVAPFFARRFTQMRWAVLTPERCMAWNGGSVVFSPGALKSNAPPPDAGEALWLTYYQNIFNPARLKLKAMHKEMPRRYWCNLPEAQFISTLSADASKREAAMINQFPSTPKRRIPAFKAHSAALQPAQQLL